MSHPMVWRLLPVLMFGPMIGGADAGQVFHVSGKVESIQQNSGNALSSISLGTTYVGTITFDDSAPPTYSSPGYAAYSPGSVIFDVTIGGSLHLTRTGAVPGANYTTNSFVIYDDLNLSFDEAYLTSQSYDSSSSSGQFVSRGEYAQLGLLDYPFNAAVSDSITSTSLSGFSPDISKFSSRYIRFGKFDSASLSDYPWTQYFNDNYVLRLGIDSLVVESQALATPEPGTVALAASALPVGMGLWLKRRRKALAA